MKVIDLLNKIANGEIKQEFEFKMNDEYFKVLDKGYYFEIVNATGMNLFYAKNLNVLSNKIEIIEEEKKIELPSKLELKDFEGLSCIELHETFNNKLNKILDYLKYKEEKERE